MKSDINDQPPVSAKVAAAGIGGAVTIILVWGLRLAGIEVPAEVASAFTTLAAFGAGYFKKS